MNQEEAAKQAYKEMLKNKEAAGDTRQQKKASDNKNREINKQRKRAEKHIKGFDAWSSNNSTTSGASGDLG